MVNPMENKKQTIPTDLITWVSCTDCEIYPRIAGGSRQWWLEDPTKEENQSAAGFLAKVSSPNLTPRRSRESVLVAGPANRISTPNSLGMFGMVIQT